MALLNVMNGENSRYLHQLEFTKENRKKYQILKKKAKQFSSKFNLVKENQ